MKKKIYLHTSDVGNIAALKQDIKFEIAACYDPISLSKMHQNEYGRIRNYSNDYHILVGQVRQDFCPWCGERPHIKKVRESNGLSYSQYCMWCPRCFSRGPTLNVSSEMETQKILVDEYTSFMEERYSWRLAWDHNLNIQGTSNEL